MIPLLLAPILLGQVLVTPTSLAHIFKPTVRPLTIEERWDYSVARSTAIGVGTVREIRLASPEPPPQSGIGVLYRETYRITIQPGQWWVGGQGPVAFEVIVSATRLKTDVYQSVPEVDPRREYVFFLEEFDSNWYLLESDYGFQGGIVEVGDQDLDLLEEAVLSSRRRHSLDSLIARSDLIVIGTPAVGKLSDCPTPARAEAKCSVIQVESYLMGSQLSREINAFNLFGALPAVRSLLFLREVNNGIYETVPVYGGMLLIQNNQIENLGMALDVARSEIMRLAKIINVPDLLPPLEEDTQPAELGDEEATSEP